MLDDIKKRTPERGSFFYAMNLTFYKVLAHMKNLNITKLAEKLKIPGTLEFNSRVQILKATGVKVVNLTLGEPDFPTPKNIGEAAIGAIKNGYTHYPPVAGIFELREAIVKKLWKDNGINYLPSEVIVGVGTKQLLHAAFQVLCQKGDEALLFSPLWSTYAEQVKLASARPKIVALKPPFKLTAKEFERNISARTKLAVLNSPANPTGATIALEELKKIADLAVKKKIWVISDDIYEHIIYGGKHHSIASLSEKIRQQTITINGFSKSYAMTGWRVGYAAGPRKVIDAMAALSGQITSGTCSISQYAALEAVSGNQNSVAMMVREFRERRDYAYGELSTVKKISLLKPEGAFYLFLDIKCLLGEKFKTSALWAQTLLETEKVAVIPGEVFMAPGYVRLSFAVSMEELKKGIIGIKRFIGKHS